MLDPEAAVCSHVIPVYRYALANVLVATAKPLKTSPKPDAATFDDEMSGRR